MSVSLRSRRDTHVHMRERLQRGRCDDRGRSRDLRRLSRPKLARETVTYTCMPYVWNWSWDVVNSTLDLVLSLFTHTNANQAIAVASKGCWFFLPDPLTEDRAVQRRI